MIEKYKYGMHKTNYSFVILTVSQLTMLISLSKELFKCCDM